MIAKKLTTLRRGIRQRGLLGFLRYYLWESDNDLLGRWIELRGGVVDIEGLKIDTNSRVIPTQHKTQLLRDRFEKPERQAIKKFLNPSLPVIELGGSLGVVACMTNRLLHSPNQHVVIEAHPDLARLLRLNKTRNACAFDVIEKAIAYGTPTVIFREDGFSSTVQPILSERDNIGSIEVGTISLAEVKQQAGFERFTLICDIEGTELELLAHEAQLLSAWVAWIIIELHPVIVGQQQHEAFIRELLALGFAQRYQEQNVYVFQNTAF